VLLLEVPLLALLLLLLLLVATMLDLSGPEE
jgi:hypothetical protein